MTTSTVKRRRRAHGRPILAAVAGLLFGLSISVALASFGAVTLSSPALAAIPLAMLVLAVPWALWAPLGRVRRG